MQQSLPSMVAAVRISDLGQVRLVSSSLRSCTRLVADLRLCFLSSPQGVNPFRILSMRGLPDHPTDKKYPREEWIDQGKPPPADAGAPGTGPAPDLDQSGDYVVSLSTTRTMGSNRADSSSVLPSRRTSRSPSPTLLNPDNRTNFEARTSTF